MGAIPWDTIISSGSSFLGGLLDESDELESESRIKSAAYNARYAYPGQKALGGKVSNYLWENLNMGLTEPEKRLMRGAGRTSILQGVKSATTDTRRQAASQGLRGGTIANIIANIQQQKIPAFGKLETDIQSKDIDLKRKRIADILTYLSLSAGYGEDAGSSSGSNNTISGIINSLYGGSGNLSGGVGPGGGNAPPTTSSGLNISNSAIGKGVAAIPGLGLIAGIIAQMGGFTGEPGHVADLTQSGYSGGSSGTGAPVGYGIGSDGGYDSPSPTAIGGFGY